MIILILEVFILFARFCFSLIGLLFGLFCTILCFDRLWQYRLNCLEFSLKLSFFVHSLSLVLTTGRTIVFHCWIRLVFCNSFGFVLEIDTHFSCVISLQLTQTHQGTSYPFLKTLSKFFIGKDIRTLSF